MSIAKTKNEKTKNDEEMRRSGESEKKKIGRWGIRRGSGGDREARDDRGIVEKGGRAKKN